MEHFIAMVNIQALLFVYLLVGVIIQKIGIIHTDSRQSFVDFLLKITLPCMIFHSFNQTITAEQFSQGAIVLAVAFGIGIFAILINKVIYLRYPPERRCILQYGTIVSNAGFAGFPLVSGAYGPVALFYASIFIIPTRIFMWTSGVTLFTQSDFKTRMKKVVLNPGIIAAALGLTSMLTGFTPHPVISTAIKQLGDCTGPISMIIIGTVLAELKLKTLLEPGILFLCFIRLGLLPFLVLVAMKGLHLDPMAVAAGVSLTAMPVGATTALLAQTYGADDLYGSKCIFVSTILSLVTVPLFSLLL